MLFRHQSRHTTAPNTTTSMADVPCYRTVIITTTLVVGETLGIYPTVEGCGIPGPFYQKLPFSCYATVGRTQLDTSCPSVRRPSGVLVRRTYRPIFTVPIDQTIHGGLDRCASTIVNSSSVQFAMYPFSKCRFALLMRTRSPTMNLGVPTLS